MEFKHILPRLRVVQRDRYLLAKCAGKKVLHLGAVDYYKGEVCGLHKRLMSVAKSVIGIDIDKSGIERAKLEGINNIYYGNLENFDEVTISERSDVIIAGEIIEHLSNPGLFLEGVKRFFNHQTEMVLTTPNVFSPHRFLLNFVGIEYVHPDHVCYYSWATLRHLLESYNFVIKEELTYVLRGRFGNLVRVLTKINPHFANGLILVVKI